MRSWLTRHRAVVGYVFLVLATAAVLEWHHNKTTSEIADLQRQVCVRSTVLADNQRVVLETLIAVVRQEATERRHAPAGHIEDQLMRLRDRLDSVPEFDCPAP